MSVRANQKALRSTAGKMERQKWPIEPVQMPGAVKCCCNMTFLMRCIALGREQFGLPEKEARIATHFIR